MAGTVRILRSTQEESLRALHTLTLPGDAHEDYSAGSWWIGWDGDSPVGFAGIRGCNTWPGAAYLSRVGVLPSHRGQGLQGRFMRAAEREARKQGFTHLLSTTYENPASANNFIRQGYLTYTPNGPWGALGTIYWLKSIQP